MPKRFKKNEIRTSRTGKQYYFFSIPHIEGDIKGIYFNESGFWCPTLISGRQRRWIKRKELEDNRRAQEFCSAIVGQSEVNWNPPTLLELFARNRGILSQVHPLAFQPPLSGDMSIRILTYLNFSFTDLRIFDERRCRKQIIVQYLSVYFCKDIAWYISEFLLPLSIPTFHWLPWE